jgi:hypothetical protein
MNKVHVGSKYIFNPVMFDVLNPPFNVKPGDTVKVINLPGCPKANTMGMCYVADEAGKFGGMVMCNSLTKVEVSA